MTSYRKWRILPYLDLKKQISRELFIQSWRTIPFFSSLDQALLDSVTHFSAFGHPQIHVVRVPPLNFLNIGYYEVIVTSQRVCHISDRTPYFFWKLIPSPFQRYITCYINKNYSRERIFLQMHPDYLYLSCNEFLIHIKQTTTNLTKLFWSNTWSDPCKTPHWAI